MTEPTEFLKNERPNEFLASFRVWGEISVTIKAETLEEATDKALAMTDDEDFGLELDEADEVEVRHVSKIPAMFLVLRDGRTMQVSRLQPGDQPRLPDERGF